MKKPAVAITIILTLSCGAGGEAVSQFDGARALGYVKTQVDFGPRVPNTEGHRLTGDWILAHLRSTADTVEVQAFDHVTVDGDTLALRNFIGRFRPEVDDRVLLFAHWDTRPHADKSFNMADRRLPVIGANDGASGVAILLGLADELASLPPALGVDLLFVDGEDYGDFVADKDVLIGSRYFATNKPEDYQPLFGVLFDMVGDADAVFPKEWYSVNGAPEVVERVWRIAGDLGYGSLFRNNVSQGATDDHIPMQEVGIRAIDIIHQPFPDYHHTTGDTLENVSARTLEMVGNVAVAIVR